MAHVTVEDYQKMFVGLQLVHALRDNIAHSARDAVNNAFFAEHPQFFNAPGAPWPHGVTVGNNAVQVNSVAGDQTQNLERLYTVAPGGFPTPVFSQEPPHRISTLGPMNTFPRSPQVPFQAYDQEQAGRKDEKGAVQIWDTSLEDYMLQVGPSSALSHHLAILCQHDHLAVQVKAPPIPRAQLFCPATVYDYCATYAYVSAWNYNEHVFGATRPFAISGGKEDLHDRILTLGLHGANWNPTPEGHLFSGRGVHWLKGGYLYPADEWEQSINTASSLHISLGELEGSHAKKRDDLISALLKASKRGLSSVAAMAIGNYVQGRNMLFSVDSTNTLIVDKTIFVWLLVCMDEEDREAVQRDTLAPSDWLKPGMGLDENGYMPGLPYPFLFSLAHIYYFSRLYDFCEPR